MRIPKAIDHPRPLGPALTDVSLFIFSGSHLGDDLMKEIYLLHTTHPNNQSIHVKHELTPLAGYSESLREQAGAASTMDTNSNIPGSIGRWPVGFGCQPKRNLQILNHE
jgi:hypothetical protein